MKKKTLSAVFAALAATCVCAGFSACGKTDAGNGAQNDKIREIYASYVAHAEENGDTPLSYEEWLKSIKGEKGEKGDPGAQGEKGADGKSAYEIWLEQGHTGSEQDFLDWIKTAQPGGENKLAFKTLEIKDNSANLTVSNATKEFSFKNEITASGSAKYIVALDEYGVYQSATKIVPLEAGDNKFYIFEKLDEEIVKTYTIKIRRRPMYTVTFHSNGGAEVQPQQVEEDSFAAEPAAQSKAGYTFDKWDYDFSKPITQNTSVSAAWKARTDTPYKVQYYLENADDNGYTLRETVDLQGETDTTATAQIKSFEHFSHKSTATDSGNINGNGSLVLKVYYTREMLTVIFNGYGNETETKMVKYGGKVSAPEFTRTGYTQNGWNMPLPETISGNITLSAEWQINQYTLTLVLGGGQENKTITQDYGSAIENIEILERAGYDFDGWNGVLPETMPAENRTLTASWNAIFTLSESGDTITGLTNYGKNAIKLMIPEAIDGVKIVDISSAAFTNCNGAAYNEKDNLKYIGSKDNPYLFLVKASKNLESFEIDSGCKYIGDSAFYQCSNLTGIEIPNGVITIGVSSFYDCSNLTSIKIPNSVVSIGCWAFESCGRLTYNTKNNLKYLGSPENLYLYLAYTTNSSITEANIDKNCRFIGESAFSGCSGLTSITIPKGVTSIGCLAFYECSRLADITIPDSVTSIGGSAFQDCSGLISIAIPNSVTFIDEFAFKDCSGLTSVTIGNGVTSIGESAFSGCSGLTSVTMGNSVTSIGRSAFSSCSGLTSITIPDSVTSIGSDAFWYCSGLTSITIPDSVTSIGGGAFGICTWLDKIFYQGTKDDWNKISINYYDNEELTKATRYYYSETKPTESGNYWHYNDRHEIEEW